MTKPILGLKGLRVSGLKCLLRHWLSPLNLKHRPELRDPPDAAQQALFDTGHTVGGLACQLFPGGVEIAFDAKNFDGMMVKTRQLIDFG
ncbi:hypothetical protein JX580_04600 [Thiomicrospira microaerophila]|uniref:hypothetical protein n=1 Tax=Thiomicrospira microaerophila TaxID=406020 RepID=UPI00200D2743|nr:hypothetical protein [Thiomicrospira microaerophila]UQB43162.1 hypothetical protein JX580_04600 [Thiomicrospira microaerophila]